MNDYFERTIRLLGEEQFENVSKLSVVLLGLGGVGGSACEQLTRLGIGYITIVDNDKIAESNLNRQIIATTKTIGQYKTEAFKERMISINPNTRVDAKTIYFDESTLDEVFDKHYDYIIDCIDSVNSKLLLYKVAIEKNVKIISCMGTANKIDPSKLKISRLDKTADDKLAKKMRELCKKNGVDMKKINVCYSNEQNYSENKINPLPSISLVPNAAGVMCAYFVLDDLLHCNK